MLFCNETDSGSCRDPKGCRLPTGAESREKSWKGAVTVARTDNGSPADGAVSDGDRWLRINWHKAVKIVSRLQTRIVKAVRAGDARRSRGLRRILANSRAARLMAVRRVTSNRGKRTAGVDGVRLKTPASRWQEAGKLNSPGYRPKPLRRIYIPRKNGKKRPLGIPAMRDRSEQAAELSALDPVAECTADMHSYGFRKKRSVHDAIEACYNALRLKGSAKWVLEADIKGCFDNISHRRMTDNVPTNREKLRLWLKAGYMERGMFSPTETGTPQGGIISPTLANMALDGMEKLLRDKFGKTHKIHLVRYADDFIITGATKELLENEVKPLIAEFLKERGLGLSEEKTKISHIDDGFDFLGFNIRKYRGKLMTRPAKSAIASVKEKIREIVRANATAKTENLIGQLNPVIRGWANHFRHVVSSKIFGSIDHAIWEKTWRWAKRRHPDKSLPWIKSKYFQREGNRKWVFREKGRKFALFKMADVPIRRHVKIRADANPYDPEWEEYFRERETKSHKRNVKDKSGGLWVRQNGICPICHTILNEEEEWDIHHLIPKSEGGDDSMANLALVHISCHREYHRYGSVAGCLTVSYQCPSRMKGNFHVRFFGGEGAVMR